MALTMLQISKTDFVEEFLQLMKTWLLMMCSQQRRQQFQFAVSSLIQGFIYCKKSETMPISKFKMEKICQS
jgi:hypothetical protein